MRLRLPLIAAASALLATAAPAATITEASGSFALAAGAIPEGLSVTLEAPYAFADSYEGPGDAVADAQAEGDDVSGAVSAQAVAYGGAGSVAQAVYGVAAFVSNGTDAALSLSGVLDYDLAVSAASDDPGGKIAYASIFVELLIDGDLVFFEEVLRDVDQLGADGSTGSFEQALEVPAFGETLVEVYLDAYVVAVDAAPIPLPAALPLLAAGLGGLALLRRRRDARD